ncbi:hypothetical protein D1872_323510 [compost metagenome]
MARLDQLAQSIRILFDVQTIAFTGQMQIIRRNQLAFPQKKAMIQALQRFAEQAAGLDHAIGPAERSCHFQFV